MKCDWCLGEITRVEMANGKVWETRITRQQPSPRDQGPMMSLVMHRHCARAFAADILLNLSARAEDKKALEEQAVMEDAATI